jgi:hypothetical protein
MATFTSSVSSAASSKRPVRAVPTRPRDVYAYWLEQSRPLTADESKARLLWFETVPLHHKTQALFELEGALKAIAALASIPRWAEQEQINPSTISARDLMYLMQHGVQYALHRANELMGAEPDSGALSPRSSKVAEIGPLARDAGEWRHPPYAMMEHSAQQRTPEESLDRLCESLRHAHALCSRWLEHAEIPLDVWTATHATVVQQIQQNRYFNPLFVLDYRAELDRIRVPSVLGLLQDVRFVSLHRVLVLLFLWRSRVERYIDWATELLFKQVEVHSHPAGWLPMQTASLVYGIWSVVYAETLAYCSWNEQYLRHALHQEVHQELLSFPADQTLAQYEQIRGQLKALPLLTSAFESWLRRLSAEVRDGSYHLYQLLPNHVTMAAAAETSGATSKATSADGHVESARRVLGSMQHLLRHGADTILSMVAPARDLTPPRDEVQARVEQSETLRQQAWMFAQVLRAFAEHARLIDYRAAPWEAQSDVRFVSDFLEHFRSLGYQLLRMSDYQRMDPFLKAIERLRQLESLDASHLQYMAQECDSLRSFLLSLVDQISARAELQSRPFDKRKAATILKAHLHATQHA